MLQRTTIKSRAWSGGLPKAALARRRCGHDRRARAMLISVYALNDQLVTVQARAAWLSAAQHCVGGPRLTLPNVGVLAQVDGDTTVETLKAILEAETQIPAGQQALVWGNRVLLNRCAFFCCAVLLLLCAHTADSHIALLCSTACSSSLDAAGVKDGDVLQVCVKLLRPPCTRSAAWPASRLWPFVASFHRWLPIWQRQPLARAQQHNPAQEEAQALLQLPPQHKTGIERLLSIDNELRGGRCNATRGWPAAGAV